MSEQKVHRTTTDEAWARLSAAKDEVERRRKIFVECQRADDVEWSRSIPPWVQNLLIAILAIVLVIAAHDLVVDVLWDGHGRWVDFWRSALMIRRP